MKRSYSQPVTPIVICMLVLMASSLACNLPDLQDMVQRTVLETIFKGIQDNEEVQSVASEVLGELLGPDALAGERVFTGTSNYDGIFKDVRCPGYETKENLLAITVGEEGAVSGIVRYVYNTGSCEYTEKDQTYTQVVEFSITGTFEGQIVDDGGTITLYENVDCVTVYDSSGVYPDDPDCNLFPYRDVDITISGSQMTGLIRVPASGDPDGLFNVTFSAMSE